MQPQLPYSFCKRFGVLADFASASGKLRLRLKKSASAEAVSEAQRKLGMAEEIEFDVYFSSSILTRIHYTIHTDPLLNLSVDPAALEKSVQEIARDWNDNLHEALKLQYGRESADVILEKFRDCLKFAI